MSGHFIKHWLLEAYWTSSIGSVAQSAPSITLQITGAFFHFPPFLEELSNPVLFKKYAIVGDKPKGSIAHPLFGL